MLDLISSEQDYYSRLSADEKQVYIASAAQLIKMRSCNDYMVNSFVDAALQLAELSRLHEQYNTVYDEYPVAETVEDLLDATFSMTISIGRHAAVFQLASMDETDALYEYLAAVKMNRFNWMSDYYDINELAHLIN